jgi:four helix bundle protein
MKKRTKRFAVDVIRFSDSLPGSRAASVIANQLIRSATSVGANYRAALRSRSQAEFIAKIGVTREEVDESEYWLELLEEASVSEGDVLLSLKQEANELTAILTATLKTTKSHSIRYPKSQIGNQQS